MRTSIVCLILSGVLSAAMAGVTVGLTLQNTYHAWNQDNGRQNGEDGNSYMRLRLGPVLSLMATDRLEVAPTLGVVVSVDRNRYAANASGNNVTDRLTSQAGVFAGCGLFFHVIERDPFVLSIGPDVGAEVSFKPKMHEERADGTESTSRPDDYSNFGLGAGLPLNLDILLGEAWKVRITGGLLSLWWHRVNEGGNTQDTFDYSLQSILQPFFTIVSHVLRCIGAWHRS